MYKLTRPASCAPRLMTSIGQNGCVGLVELPCASLAQETAFGLTTKNLQLLILQGLLHLHLEPQLHLHLHLHQEPQLHLHQEPQLHLHLHQEPQLHLHLDPKLHPQGLQNLSHSVWGVLLFSK